MTAYSPIEGFISQLRELLGWRRWVERRAVIEIRAHLEDAAEHHLRLGATQEEAELRSIEDLGGIDEARRFVVESNRGLTLESFLRDRALVVAGMLSLPAILLLGLSFLTFNFPCREITSGGQLYEDCGMLSLQFLRGPLGGLGLFGMPPWWQWTQFVLTTLGPLAAGIVLLRTQVRTGLGRREGATTATVVIHSDRVLKLATVGAFALFIIVVAYKTAG